MFQRYTERARRIVFFARYHAATLSRSTVDTEHLLLGLLTEGKGLSGGFLSTKHFSVDLVRDYLGADDDAKPIDTASLEIPFSGAAERALVFAAEEADDPVPDGYIDAEQVLLGLLREGGMAAALLRSHGVLLSECRDAVRKESKGLDLPVDADLSPDQLFTLLTALSDYFRVLGGAALLLEDFDLQTAELGASRLGQLRLRLEPLPAREWRGSIGEEFRRTLAAEYQHTSRNLRFWERTSAIRALDWRPATIESEHREALHRYAREELARLEIESERGGSPEDDDGHTWFEERCAGEGRFFQMFSDTSVAVGTDSCGALRFGRLEPESDDDRVVRSPRLHLQVEYGGDRRVDLLTGLPSIRSFESALDRFLAAPLGPGETIAVIATDLDGFKRINDAFGHYAGDEVLLHVARLLHTHRAEGTALVARIGADDFFLAIGPVTETAARAFAALIRSQVASLSIPWLNQTLGPLSLSTGLAFFPRDGRSPHELFQAAGRALWHGRSGYELPPSPPGNDEPPPSCPVAKRPSKPRPRTDARARLQ